MNTKQGVFMVALLAGSGGAVAEGFYVGAKVGLMDTDVSELDPATNGGILVGYEFPTNGGIRWGIEGEYTDTISEGDVDGTSGDWDIQTQAIYGVLRVGERFYGKARIGYLKEDVTVDLGFAEVSEDDSGGSLGFGVGWQPATQFSIEGEYTLVEEDVSFYSVGANFWF